ncbi:hypothetical protein MMC29_001273, partial [Sticta canariensis]|nr:hypothetical protein [Sticta canariensis]
MDSQPHPSLSPADHLHRAGASVSFTFQRCISSISSDRLHHVVAHALLLLLRFGQVAATAILTLVFGYMVYEHHTHWCAWDPSGNACSRYWYGGGDPNEVPWSYGVVIGTALASFFQLYLLMLLRLRLSSSSRDSFSSSRHTLSRTLSPLLSRTDIPILLLYIFAFASLSDHVVPSGILRGARSGTGCYLGYKYSRSADVLL